MLRKNLGHLGSCLTKNLRKSYENKMIKLKKNLRSAKKVF